VRSDSVFGISCGEIAKMSWDKTVKSANFPGSRVPLSLTLARFHARRFPRGLAPVRDEHIQLIALAALTVEFRHSTDGCLSGGIPGVFVERYFSSSLSPR
jgi:hypothetical protein